MIQKINLSDYLTEGSRIFCGYVEGKKLASHLSIHASTKNNIELVIDDSILTITQPFFLGLLNTYLQSLNEEEIHQKIKIQTDNRHISDIYYQSINYHYRNKKIRCYN